MERAPGAPWWSAFAVLVLLVVMWEDVARNGPWQGVPGPLELAGLPLSVSAGWLLAGTAARLASAPGWRGAGPRPRTAAAEPALPRLPVFLRFDGRRVVVVGGGAVAAAKIPALLDAGADVTVIAPGDLARHRPLAGAGACNGRSRPPTSTAPGS